MIKRDSTITVNNNVATLDNDIYLYKYDKNIQITFTIVNSKYMYDNDSTNNLVANAQASYAQVKFKKDDDATNTIEIEFDIQATKKGAVILTISEELTDEDTEIGDYSIQIRLLDSKKEAVLTLPPIKSCIHIQQPLFDKLGASNLTDDAIVDQALTTYAAPLKAVEDDGTFAKKTWVPKEKITTAELNRMEDGIGYNNTQLKDIKSKQIILEKDDTSMNGIDDTTHDTLTTTDKTIIGGINEVNSQCKDIANLKNTGLTLTQIDLLKDVLYKMEFSTEELATQGKQAIDKLISSLKNTQSEDKVLISIYAVYNGGDVLVGTDINSLDIIVTGNYSDGSTVNITNFTVSGKIENGENTITVSYNDKTTTITVIGYVEGKNDIKGDVVFSDNYISKNKDYSFYQLTSEVGRRAYSIPITANKKYTLTWDLDNQYRNPNIGSIDYSTGILNKDNAIWLICTTSDMKNSTTERTTGTFESPTILTNLYTQQKGDDNNYYTSAEITWANDGYFSIDDSEIVPVHIYEG